LNEIALSVLVAQVGKHPTHVFTFRGKPVTNVSTKAWWAALERSGIKDFRWQDLRHTFATWHRQAGTPTHELQRLGGWKTLVMVERYAHVAPEGLQVVTESDLSIAPTFRKAASKMCGAPLTARRSCFEAASSGGIYTLRSVDADIDFGKDRVSDETVPMRPRVHALKGRRVRRLFRGVEAGLGVKVDSGHSHAA
jgi:hypothetical protein